VDDLPFSILKITPFSFIRNFGTIVSANDLLKEGDRTLWYKVQPYLLGLFTSRGIPMLWQEQEF
jgi:hypothetical protein